MCWLVRRNSVRSAARSFVSGTIAAGRRSSSTLHLGDAPVVHGGEEVADMEDAGDVVDRLAVDRVAGVGRLEHGQEHVLGRHRE